MNTIETGQRFEDKERTKDVLTGETVEFKDLHLSDDVLSGLTKSEFKKPSPIQLKAIPYGRCGLDLIVQAKSGTGKTCVFTVIALEAVVVEKKSLQAIMLAPTREIALQICDVVRSIGQDIKGLNVGVFIGGIPLSEDKKNICDCQIAIASPGRLKQLIELEIISCKSVRLFVLDEADKLLNEESFQQQINWIFSMLPTNKQIIAASATYPDNLETFIKNYMRNPSLVRLNPSDMALVGLQQFYLQLKNLNAVYKNFQAKISTVTDILTSRQFTQALVFSNYHSHAKSLCEACISAGFSATYISGGMEQTQRIEAIKKLKQFQCRVLISTDLTARGIDSHNVDIVINMDIPEDWETYLHRIGRAGRFGARGVAISIACEGQEIDNLMNIIKVCNMDISSYQLNKSLNTQNLPSIASKDHTNVGHVKMTNLNTSNNPSIPQNVHHNIKAAPAPPNNHEEIQIRLPSLPDVVANVMFSKPPSIYSLLSFDELSKDFDHFTQKGEFKVWNEEEIYKRIPIQEVDKTSNVNNSDKGSSHPQHNANHEHPSVQPADISIRKQSPNLHPKQTKVNESRSEGNSNFTQKQESLSGSSCENNISLKKTSRNIREQLEVKHDHERKSKLCASKSKNKRIKHKKKVYKTNEETKYENETSVPMLFPQFSHSAEKEYWKNIRRWQKQCLKQQQEAHKQWNKYCKSVSKYYQQT